MDIGELLAREAIRAVLHRYARGSDRQDRALLESVYHPDAVEHHGLYDGPAAGFIDSVLRGDFGVVASTHHLTTMNIRVDGDVAYGETYFKCDSLRRDTDDALITLRLSGRYLDRFERRNGEWRIVERTVVCDLRDDRPWTEPLSTFEYLQGSPDRNDASYREGFIGG